MFDATTRIADYTVRGRDGFFTDARTQDAVVRHLAISGEAAKRVSVATRTKAPDLPWNRIVGMRDKLIHTYAGVDLVIVWPVVERNALGLCNGISRLLHDSRQE